MKIRLFVQSAASMAVGIFFTLSNFSAIAAEPAWWTQQKIDCGLPSSLAYEDWVAEGSPCNSGNASTTTSSSAAPSIPSAPAGWTPQQQMILNAGQAAMPALQQMSHDFFWGKPVDPAQQAAQQAAQQEQQQRQLAAQQLNNSGIYLLKQKDYLGAINEFQQALAQTPNDPNIIRNLALAKQKIKDTAVAVQNSGALSQLLGSQPLQQSTTAQPNISPLNLVNLNANTVDLRDHPLTALNSLNVNYDTSAVDLRGLGKQNSTEEEYQNRNQQALQRQLDQVFNPIIADSHAVNFSGLGKTKSANTSSGISDQQKIYQQELNNTLDSNPAPQPAQNQQKLQDQLNNVLGANFDGQAHN